MVQIFQPDYVENMCFEFVFNKFIQHIEIYGLCQTRLIFLICFMSLSWHHGSQEKFYLKHSQNEETRNSDFKKSISQYVSYQTFDRNSSIHDKMTKKNYKNLESLWFYHFYWWISFLVSCCYFCSLILTEVLTGLPWILSSDWLNKSSKKQTSCGWERVWKRAFFAST